MYSGDVTWPNCTDLELLPCGFAAVVAVGTIVTAVVAVVVTATVALTTALTIALAIAVASWGAAGEVNPEAAAMEILALQLLPSLLGARNIDEVGVCEAPGRAGAAVDGDTDVNDVLDIFEHVVEILVGHLEGHVADEERFARGCWCGVAPALFLVELHDEAAAFEDLEIEVVDGGFGIFDVLELNVAKAGWGCQTILVGGGRTLRERGSGRTLCSCPGRPEQA